VSNFAVSEMRRLAAAYRELAQKDDAQRPGWLEVAESMEAQAERIEREAATVPAEIKAKHLGLAVRSARGRSDRDMH
jgi:hypothetical protein